MITPKLTVDKGEVKVKRNGVTRTVKKGDDPFPLQVCDEISTDKAIETDWSIKAAHQEGHFDGIHEKKGAGGEGNTHHYKENRGDQAIFEITAGPLANALGLGGKTYVSVYIDPPPSLVAETPTVRASYCQAVYVVQYDPAADRSIFTVLDGHIDTALEDSPEQVTTVNAGQEATYERGRLVGIKAAQGYPRAPVRTLVVPEGGARRVIWSQVTEGVGGDSINVAAYNIYRSGEACFANTPETLIASTADLSYLDRDIPCGPVYYRVSGIASAGAELREGPASELARRVDTEHAVWELKRQVSRFAELFGGPVGPLGLVPQIVDTVMPIVKRNIAGLSFRGVKGGGTGMDANSNSPYWTAASDMHLTVTHKDGTTQEHIIPKGTKFTMGDPMYTGRG